MSRHSTAKGDLPLARTQLIDGLTAAQSDGTPRPGARCLQAAAELAAAASDPEWSVVFYGAVERIGVALEHPEDSAWGTTRREAQERLRLELGDQRYESARSASMVTPSPLEFYMNRALTWLDEIQPRLHPGHEPILAHDVGTTVRLVAQAQTGSMTAREGLASRYMKPLRRMAHGALPRGTRDLMDTDDLVQVTVVRGLEKLDTVRIREKGHFLSYLRRILLNQIRDEARRIMRKSIPAIPVEAVASPEPSPLDDLLARETQDAYRAVLSRLPVRQHNAIVLRVEHGCSYEDVASAVGCPSANAARMLVTRGLQAVTRSLRKL